MTAFPFDALLAETRWLSGLARQLAGNEHDAADLVQDTLLTAVQQPVHAERPVRGWLRSVLLSRFHDRHRRERALRAREDAVAHARGEGEPAADIVQKAEAHRRLVEAVLALDEPLCTCVLLRFFENLPPRAIAARTGAPVATVHSRLQRGLAQLRARLADEHGPRWRGALAPLLLRPSTLLLGVPLVHATVKVAIGAAVLLVASVYFWPDPPLRPEATLVAAESGGAAAVVPAGTVALANEEPSETRREIAPPPTTPPPAAEVPVRGRVLDARGTGVAGVGLTWRRPGAEAAAEVISGPDGGFELVPAAAGATVVSADRRWSTVLMGLVRPQSGHPCTVVVAPRIDVAGRVVDATGAPVPAVAVSAHMPQALGTDFGVLLDFTTPREWKSVADAQGRFRLDDVPSVAAAFVLAELGGWLPRMAPLPTASTEQFEFVLERPGATASLVAGVVVDQWGAAVAGARVSAGGPVARSDAHGAFTLDVSGGELGDRLVAVADGMQPALHVPERDAAGKPRWPARVVLQLGPPPLSLAGRVVFADGKAAAGAKVWINDPTVVGIEDDAVIAEHVLTGQEPFWVPIVAGDDGSFRLEGLADRAYTVRALDPHTLLQATVSGLAAGRRDVELRLPGEVFPRLVVRVATRDGEPVKNVHVRLQRPALEVNVPGGTRDEWSNGQKGRTDERGEITFTDVPTSGVEVFTAGDEIMFAGRNIGPDADPAGFVLTVDRRMHLQVDVAPPFDRVDQCRVLDADGKPMLLRIIRGNASRTNRTADVVDGKSHILSLGEGARAVVFFCKGQEVGRMPVQLVAREVTTVRF